MQDPVSSSRRKLLKGSAALLAASLSGCATSGKTAKVRVVVIGGGWGGLGAVRALAGNPQIDITLIEPNARFMSCPLSVLYVAGVAPARDFQRDYDQIDRLGIRRVKDRVLEIDRARKVVNTGNQSYSYDFLVIATGVEYMEEALPGYTAAKEMLPVGFRAFEQEAVHKQVAQFLEHGGNFLITVPKPPYRCPPAPYERACMIAEQMKAKRTKGKIIVVDTNPHPMPAPIAKPIESAMKELYADQIEYIKGVDLKGIDGSKRTLLSSRGDIPFNHANIILPMRAPGLIRQSGLGERFANVKLPSFQSTADDHIYVIGDSQGQPLPKSGHVAFGAGQQVGSHILETIAGTSKKLELGDLSTLPAGICWAKVSKTHAIMINVTGSIEFGQPPQLKYQVDPAHNTASSKAAMTWGQDMWNAMLG